MREFAGVALVDPRGWVLMQERDEHPLIDPECWGLPGGAVEAGETPEQAAHRELEEETGVRLDGALTCLGQVDVSPDGLGPLRCSTYVAATELGDRDVECHEGRRMVFVDPEVARTLPLTHHARAAWPSLLASSAYAAALR